MHVARLIVFISGFRQSAKRFNGVLRQFLAAMERRRELAAGDARIEYRAWDTNWEEFGEYCRNMVGLFGEVSIVGYSWGAGWGAKRLAVELQARGIEIPRMLLCDPVYRSPVLPAWLPLNPLSLIHRGRLTPRIKLPSNIRRVDWLRQEISRPRSHDLVAVNPQATRIKPPIELELIHSEMDESREFAGMSQELVEVVLRDAAVL